MPNTEKQVSSVATLTTLSPARVSSQNQIDWVNYAKGIGIFLVVVGHTLLGLIKAKIIPDSQLVESVEKFIYAFHMPLFFFISGLFVEYSFRKPLKFFLINKLQVIAYPYLVWSILQTCLQIFASQYTNQPKVSFLDIFQIGYKPIMQFWFLYTLLLILLSYAVWRKLFKLPQQLFLIGSIFIYCLHVFRVSFGDWGALYLFRRHALYFAIGSVVGSSGLLLKLRNIKTLKLIFTAIAGFFIIALTVKFQIVKNGLIVPFVAIYGITASISVAILMSRWQVAPFVSNWGLLSLEIFVAHSIASSIVRNLLQKVGHIWEPVTHLILGILVGIYVPIFLDRLADRIGFNYLFTLRDRRPSG